MKASQHAVRIMTLFGPSAETFRKRNLLGSWDVQQ